MVAKELLNKAILPMYSEYSPMEILSWMEEYKVSHLPVIKGKKYIGLLSEADIFNIDEPEKPIGKQKVFLKNISAKASQHIYEVIKLMSEQNISVVPVVDEKNSYLGMITASTIIEKFASYSAVNQPGGIIVLVINKVDYLASQIVQIVESNDAKVLSLYLASEDNSSKIYVTIKVNITDISRILQTFQRYNYEISASFFDEDIDDLQERYDSLMNYLSI
ncbi:MAG: hypothetical protein AUJ98_11370 [Bacteroidetes bacterium CG2_30_33_31]|nr:MAG: hypothetical protein AUJ98_11370 [Bacteroidetes bacterium CG2_30_33_31]